MEYLRDHGQFADLPLELFFSHLRQTYPHLFVEGSAFMRGDMHAEMQSAGLICADRHRKQSRLFCPEHCYIPRLRRAGIMAGSFPRPL
jgi:hypothetical protein